MLIITSLSLISPSGQETIIVLEVLPVKTKQGSVSNGRRNDS
jgi:hypothetical protein